MPPVRLSSLQLQAAEWSCAQTLQLPSPIQVYTWALLLTDCESLVTLPGTYALVGLVYNGSCSFPLPRVGSHLQHYRNFSANVIIISISTPAMQDVICLQGWLSACW